MNEEFKQTANEMVGYPVDISFKQIFEEDGIKYSDVLTVMQCKRLDRIADALEGINSNLSDIAVALDSLDKNIDGCISCSQNGRSRHLCITGDVTTY